MQVHGPIAIDLLDFVREGTLGPVRSGQSRAEVEQIFGAPDTLGGSSRKHRTPLIWKYGDVEIHFEQKVDRVTGIYLDAFDIPSGGRAIIIDPWIMHSGLERQTLQKELKDLGVDCRSIDTSWSNGTVAVIEVSSGVRFWFRESIDSRVEETGLYAISQVY